MMLPKIRSGAWRLRWAVAALAVMAPLAIPATASASDVPNATANSQSIQYINVAINPAAHTWPSTYDNLAQATSHTNGRTAFSVKFRVHLSYASVITANNDAVALASDCQNCGAVAIGFQMILVSKYTLAKLLAQDSASATSANCDNCHTLAEAYQIIYATDSAAPLPWQIDISLLQAWEKFEALRYSGLSVAQIESESTQLVNGIVSMLQQNSDAAPAGTAPAYTPAINNSNLPAQMAENTLPVIDVLSAIQH